MVKTKILTMMTGFLLISTIVYADSAGCHSKMQFTVHNLTHDTQSIGFRNNNGHDVTWDVSPGEKRKIDSIRCYQMHGTFYYYPANQETFYPSPEQELVIYYVLGGQVTNMYTPKNFIQMRDKSEYEVLKVQTK
jgi:hypothetical protein